MHDTHCDTPLFIDILVASCLSIRSSRKQPSWIILSRIDNNAVEHLTHCSLCLCRWCDIVRDRLKHCFHLNRRYTMFHMLIDQLDNVDMYQTNDSIHRLIDIVGPPTDNSLTTVRHRVDRIAYSAVDKGRLMVNEDLYQIDEINSARKKTVQHNDR
jgi:hypothetical protein